MNSLATAQLKSRNDYCVTKCCSLCTIIFAIVWISRLLIWKDYNYNYITYDHRFTGKHRIAVCPEPCLLYVWQLQDVLINAPGLPSWPPSTCQHQWIAVCFLEESHSLMSLGQCNYYGILNHAYVCSNVYHNRTLGWDNSFMHHNNTVITCDLPYLKLMSSATEHNYNSTPRLHHHWYFPALLGSPFPTTLETVYLQLSHPSQFMLPELAEWKFSSSLSLRSSA